MASAPGQAAALLCTPRLLVFHVTDCAMTVGAATVLSRIHNLQLEYSMIQSVQPLPTGGSVRGRSRRRAAD
jgi:hypothetical protein